MTDRVTEEKGQLSAVLQAKLTALQENIRELGSLAVGFSGGVDSSFLLAVAADVLGEKAIAVTSLALSPQEGSSVAKERRKILKGAFMMDLLYSTDFKASTDWTFLTR